MIEGNITSTGRKSSYCRTYYETVEDQKQRRHFAMASLCNGFTLPGHRVTLQ